MCPIPRDGRPVGALGELRAGSEVASESKKVKRVSGVAGELPLRGSQSSVRGSRRLWHRKIRVTGRWASREAPRALEPRSSPNAADRPGSEQHSSRSAVHGGFGRSVDGQPKRPGYRVYRRERGILFRPLAEGGSSRLPDLPGSQRVPRRASSGVPTDRSAAAGLSTNHPVRTGRLRQSGLAPLLRKDPDSTRRGAPCGQLRECCRRPVTGRRPHGLGTEDGGPETEFSEVARGMTGGRSTCGGPLPRERVRAARARGPGAPGSRLGCGRDGFRLRGVSSAGRPAADDLETASGLESFVGRD